MLLRRTAAEKLTGRRRLLYIALNYYERRPRMAAVGQMEDPQDLFTVAMHVTVKGEYADPVDIDERLYALDRLRDPQLLAQVALSADKLPVRLSAVDKLEDQTALAQADEGFARESRLLPEKNGIRTNYLLDPVKRCVRPIKLGGEVSDGLALPIEVLEKYTDIRALKNGDRISVLNGIQLCRMYIPAEMKIDIREKTLARYSYRKRAPSRMYVPWGIMAIGSGAFAGNRRITDVFLPETVTTIGEKAFYGCPALRRVVIPDSVKRIGSQAFANCPSLL